MGRDVFVCGCVVLWSGDAVLLVALRRRVLLVPRGRAGAAGRTVAQGVPVRLLSILRRGGGRSPGQRLDSGRLLHWMHDVTQCLCFVPYAPRGGGGVAWSYGAGGEIKNAPPRWGKKLRIFCNCFQTVNKGLIARGGSQNGSFIVCG